MKKLFIFLLMILLPMVASADAVEIDGIYYNLISKAKLAEVTSNPNKYIGDIILPDYITYEGNNYNVISIGDYAFSDCSGLTSIIINNSVTTIGYAAFQGCTSLLRITIPNSVTSIGQYVFQNCNGLINVSIGNGVTTIEAGAFAACNNLTCITLPNSVTSIGSFAFRSCAGLTSIELGNSVTSIGGYAFADCIGLSNITMGNCLASIGSYAFRNCSGIISMSIPNSVTTIESHAFENCSGMTSITIGNGVTNIGQWAFNGCTNLEKVIVSDIAAWCGIYMNDNPLSYAHHIYSDENTEIIEMKIPNGVKFINNNVFRECTGLTNLIIPESVNNIGDLSFFGCSSLASITIGNGIEYIGRRAFSNCQEVKDVYCYANNVPSTNPEAFADSYIEYTTLHVPQFSIDSYRTSEPWKNFKEIVKIDLPKYTLMYILDGETYRTSELEEGETISPEPAPTKEGYTFSGWSDTPETMPAHDVTVTGTFTINKYKLTYSVDGEEYKSYDIEYGSTITSESDPTKEGYTFSGWSNLPETMPAHDVTVTGTFTINKYKLTYSVDGEEYKSYDIEYGSTITSESDPTKEGYTFSGWSNLPETMPAKDVTVTGTFTVNKYKLTYSVDGEEYKSYDVEYGSTITSETEPTKEGYTFSGWSDLPETMPAKDVTVTGSFTVNKYKLTYSVDGEEYKSYDVEYGSTITSETEPTKEGYTFSGWSDLPETMPAKDVTVTGTFTVNKYKLTYSVDGEEYKSYDIEYGSTITSETEPTKEGYTFSGWSDLPETMPAKDVIVTGTFTVNKYKLTYSVDGEEYKSYDVEYGSTITSETEPTKEGYTFSGWSDLPETMPAKDVTVTGTFIINKYKVTYMIDGEVYQTVEVEYGSTITPPNPGDREGYDFAWGDYPSTMPAEDITINGTYTATDIWAVLADESDVKIYTVDGKPLNNLQKGVNILRYKDGRTQKLIIK